MSEIVLCDMSIATRVAEFGAILKKTNLTNRRGELRDLEQAMSDLAKRFITLREAGRNLFLVGNGGSAGVAGHAATDFFNVARLKAITLHEASLMTCMSNDFGYENAFARMLSQLVEPNDILIAISSSGNSANITNAAKRATEKGAEVITMSGFTFDNALRGMGDVNFWLDSHDYGFVEIGHQFLLHNISDRLNEKLCEV
ncbi:SIS domain-containing protein [Varunaivibrio sulfuroxidans]|uniref:SIS domain-containing protein n=1 Tax=Varunaivibrio sulfuroxidans TaxID=1773489 RepID=UPI001044DB6F|nr:SIS domain-containing protein [Varunaivibrio sulfuroxidans]WES29971.1 SIS domain-containing protein [Varunaivibrio sulfuroxidans]